VCGQENVEPKESVGHLVRHVTEDITHFDGKFFATLKLLLFKPGFLSQEYLKGRRASYLHPVRLYLFVTFVFFVFAFSIYRQPPTTTKDWKFVKDTSGKLMLDSSGVRTQPQINRISFGGDTSVAAYEAREAKLQPEERDGILKRYFKKRFAAITEMSHDDPKGFAEKFKEKLKHSLSPLFFTSLPFFAFALYLLYWRSRKKYYYVSHAIFSIHFYCATFIILIGTLLFDELRSISLIFLIPAALLFLAIFVYEYKAMRRFYQQGWFKTFVKFLLINIIFIVMMFVLFVGFAFNSLLATAT
jgi:hypothetical protein